MWTEVNLIQKCVYWFYLSVINKFESISALYSVYSLKLNRCIVICFVRSVRISRSKIFCARTQGSRICTTISFKWSYQTHRCIFYLMPKVWHYLDWKQRCHWQLHFKDIEVQILDPFVLAQKILDREIHTTINNLHLDLLYSIWLELKFKWKKWTENKTTSRIVIV